MALLVHKHWNRKTGGVFTRPIHDSIVQSHTPHFPVLMLANEYIEILGTNNHGDCFRRRGLPIKVRAAAKTTARLIRA